MSRTLIYHKNEDHLPVQTYRSLSKCFLSFLSISSTLFMAKSASQPRETAFSTPRSLQTTENIYQLHSFFKYVSSFLFQMKTQTLFYLQK